MSNAEVVVLGLETETTSYLRTRKKLFGYHTLKCSLLSVSAVVGQVSQDLPAWGIIGRTRKKSFLNLLRTHSSSKSYPDSSTSSPRKQTAWTPDECPRSTVTGNGGAGRTL